MPPKDWPKGLGTPGHYLRLIGKHLRTAWLEVLAVAAPLGWLLFSLLEFVLHVLRIPHWHP